MSHAWSGADPTQATDPSSYSLASTFTANVPITVTGVRVWEGASPGTLGTRNGRLWSTTGTQLAIASMPSSLPSGWSEYSFSSPVNLNTGQSAIVAYDTGGNYGFLGNAFNSAVNSADNAVTFLAAGGAPRGNGSFTSSVGNWPDVASGQNAFYGVDLVYTVTGGNTPPAITSLTASSAGAVVTSTITATPGSAGLTGATYAWQWGDGTNSSGSSPTATHTYAESGTYGILGSVTDTAGLSGYAAAAATVLLPVVSGIRTPNSLAAIAWLRTLPNLTADVVASQLPTDETTWAAHGAVVVPLTVGGAPHSSMPLRRPVMQVECWATVPNSDKLPWWKANQLAEQIRDGTYDRLTFGRALAISARGVPYPTATVKGARMLTEPRPIFSDIGDYAGFALDLELHWVQAGEVIP